MSFLLLASCVAVLGPALPGGDEGPAVELLPHGELSARLAALASAHPGLATLQLVGESRGGRRIEALRLTASEDPLETPALLLIGNLEGPRVFESGVVLRHAEDLAAAYATDEAVRELLASTVLWFVPRANPDAAEARFVEPRFERWASDTDVDNDRDGRVGEDPPADVDGDGLVTWMRVPDPDGTWRADPTDARALVEADRAKGERGTWKLYRESRDLDGDDEPGEDPAGDARVDRNFASGWEEHTPEGGLFPTDEPEARALCAFVMAQRNLALVVVYDGRGNLVQEPKSVADDAPPVKRVPPPGVLSSDAALLKELGRRYREATGSDVEGAGEDAGTFARWCYDHRGLTTLEVLLWELPDEAPEDEAPGESDEDRGAQDAEVDAAAEETVERTVRGSDGSIPSEEEEPESEPIRVKTSRGETIHARGEQQKDEAPKDGAKKDEPKPSDDAGRLAWIDAVEGESWRFVDWTPFEHPELGAVEVGGFAPWARLEPPAAEGTRIAAAHLAWFRGLGELLPRAALASCALEPLGAGGGSRLWRVEAVLQNDGFLPLLSRSVRRTRTTRPARVELVLPEAASLVAGSPRVLVEDLPGSGGRAELVWLVEGPEGIEVGVRVDTDHAGDAFRRAEVER